MPGFSEIKNTFILDFDKEDFLIVLNSETITGIHKYKNICINGIDLTDNIRLTTNKGFVIEVLKKLGDIEFMYRVIFENEFHSKKFKEPPIGYHSNYAELENFLKKLV